MKVKVTWRNKNPFAPIELLGRVSEAELPESTAFTTVENFANEATPDGYRLNKIEMADRVYLYGIDGKLIR